MWNLSLARPITSAVVANPLASRSATARIVEAISRPRPSPRKRMARPSSASANEPGIPRSATELTPSFQSNGADYLPGLEGLLLAGACGRSQTSNPFQKRAAVVRGQPRITVQETGCEMVGFTVLLPHFCGLAFRGVGIRVLIGWRFLFSFSTNLQPSTTKQA